MAIKKTTTSSSSEQPQTITVNDLVGNKASAVVAEKKEAVVSESPRRRIHISSTPEVSPSMPVASPSTTPSPAVTITPSAVSSNRVALGQRFGAVQASQKNMFLEPANFR